MTETAMPDRHYDIGGYQLHAWVTGAGEPAIVLKPAPGDVRLAVVTAGSGLVGQRALGGLPPEQLSYAHLARQREQAQTLSSRGTQTVVEGASHLSIVGDPQYAGQVARVVLALLSELRA